MEDRGLRLSLHEWPETAEDLVRILEENYPPRCKDPEESLETHMMYAGQVALVQTLRAAAVQARIEREDTSCERWDSSDHPIFERHREARVVVRARDYQD